MTVYVLGLYWNFNSFLLTDITDGAVKSNYRGAVCTQYRGSDGWVNVRDCAFNTDLADSTICEENYDCVKEGIGRAQTMTFICITTTEVFRAYTVRSFTDPVFVGMFTNKWMQLAALASILLTLFVTLVPVVNTQLGFRYISWFMWLTAFAFAFNSVFWGEMLKWYFRSSDQTVARWQSMRDGFDSILIEIRNVRHHVEHLEDKLQVAVHRPTKRLSSGNIKVC